MAIVTVNRTVKAPVSDVWASWDDFGNIFQFNPNLKASYLLNNSAPTGKGAERQCDLADGKNYIRERVIGYEPERKIVIDIFEGTLPLKRAVATFTFRSTSANSTDVQMQMDFQPKGGPLGALMVPMMKPKFRGMLQSLLDGNAAFVERGETVSQAA